MFRCNEHKHQELTKDLVLLQLRGALSQVMINMPNIPTGGLIQLAINNAIIYIERSDEND